MIDVRAEMPGQWRLLMKKYITIVLLVLILIMQVCACKKQGYEQNVDYNRTTEEGNITTAEEKTVEDEIILPSSQDSFCEKNQSDKNENNQNDVVGDDSVNRKPSAEDANQSNEDEQKSETIDDEEKEAGTSENENELGGSFFLDKDGDGFMDGWH